MENTITKEDVFAGRIIKVSVHTVQMPDGRTATREVVEHPGAVAILPVTEDGQVYLVRQYRKPVEQELLEIPAGKLEPGEDPLDCAKRELMEETGLRAEKWEKVCSYYTTPGFSNEILHLYVARGLTRGEACPDEDEDLDLVTVPLAEALSMVRQGEIRDGKSIITLFYLSLHDHGVEL